MLIQKGDLFRFSGIIIAQVTEYKDYKDWSYVLNVAPDIVIKSQLNPTTLEWIRLASSRES